MNIVKQFVDWIRAVRRRDRTNEVDRGETLTPAQVRRIGRELATSGRQAQREEQRERSKVEAREHRKEAAQLKESESLLKKAEKLPYVTLVPLPPIARLQAMSAERDKGKTLLHSHRTEGGIGGRLYLHSYGGGGYELRFTETFDEDGSVDTVESTAVSSVTFMGGRLVSYDPIT